MAVTLAEKTVPGVPAFFYGQPKGDAGVRRPVFKIVEVTFDASYPTGGEAIALDQLGFTSVMSIVAPKTAGYKFTADVSTPTAPKLLVWRGDNDAGADGPRAQVANTTNLATLVVRCLVIGLV
jgi:hypothetical protein